MKKNIPPLLMSLLFFTAANAQAQEGGLKDSYGVDWTNSYAQGWSNTIFLQNTAIEENESIAIEENQPTTQVQEPRAKDRRCPEGMNFYAKIFGGANFLQSTTIDGTKASYHTGYVFTGSLGYCWRDYGLRLEAEYAFRRNAIKKIHFVTQGFSEDGHFQTSSYMANLLWDFPLCSWGCSFWKLQPFIGAGVGYDFQKMHASNSRVIFHQKWNRFSWQAMAGLAYPIFRHTEITLEYKFHQGSHFYNHSIGVGLVYKFGFLR